MFDGWPDAAAPDLQAGLRVEAASMLNYEASATRAAERLARPLVLVGWSMGGLVALMAARRIAPDRLVLLDPSPPAEAQGSRGDVALEEGTYDPEREYGPFPDGVRARPESRLARCERRRGISVPETPCPTLVVCSDELAAERGRPVAEAYGAELLHAHGSSHWGLLADPRVAAAVLGP